MKKPKKREVATVYVIRKKGTRTYYNSLYGTFGSLAEATLRSERTTPCFDEEIVPARLTLLSSRTAKSKKRTR